MKKDLIDFGTLAPKAQGRSQTASGVKAASTEEGVRITILGDIDDRTLQNLHDSLYTIENKSDGLVVDIMRDSISIDAEERMFTKDEKVAIEKATKYLKSEKLVKLSYYEF